MQSVLDKKLLLDALLTDQFSAPSEYHPTPYWAGYANRITAELRDKGLTDFRTNDRILKGYGMSGAPRPFMPVTSWKRAVWKTLAAAPGVNKIVDEYERLLDAASFRLTQAQINFAREVLKAIAQKFPDMTIPDGSTNGGAGDGFEWRGQIVSAGLVRYLARAAGFYEVVRPETVTSMLEIGPGLGLSTLAHKALNPFLRTVVNVDITPVMYVATQFLASIPGIEVIDYTSVRNSDSIAVENGSAFRVYSLPTWSLPKVEGGLDLHSTRYSFQEMEPEAADLYITQILRLCSKGAMIQNSLLGVPTGASSQRQSVTTGFVKHKLAVKFPRCDDIATDWDQIFDSALPGMVLLLRAA